MSEDPKFKHFKELIMNHLDGLAKKEKSEVKKSILEAESMQKSGYPVGTIREWKGKKYIKVAFWKLFSFIYRRPGEGRGAGADPSFFFVGS